MRPAVHIQCRALGIPGITRSHPVPSFLWSLVENFSGRVKTLFCRNTEQIQEAKSHLCGQRFLLVNPEVVGRVTNCCHLLLVHFQAPKLQQTKFTAASRNCKSFRSLGKREETTCYIYPKSRQALLRPRALVPLLWLLAFSTLAFLPCNRCTVSDLNVWPWESQLSFLMLFSKE